VVAPAGTKALLQGFARQGLFSLLALMSVGRFGSCHQISALVIDAKNLLFSLSR
jgi:hypothetical protein